MTRAPVPPPFARRPKLSLAGLMLVILIIAAGTAWHIHLRKQEEFRRWRDETLQSSGAILTRARGEVEGLTWMPSGAPSPCCDPLTPEQIRALAACPQLKEVYLGGLSLTDATLAVLTRLPRLEAIRSDLPQVTDGGMHNLARARHLKSLEWDGVPGITDAAFNSFEKLVDLETLMIREAKLTGSGLDRLASLPKLERLELDRVTLSRDGLARLGRLSRLRQLTLAGDYADADFSVVAKLTNLRKLTLGASRCTVSVLDHLATLPHLEALNLEITGVDDVWLDRLSGLKLKSLRIFNLSYAQASPGAVGRLHAAYPGAVIVVNGKRQ